MKPEIPAEAVEKMKREGWASIEEQEKYWEEKDRQVHAALSAAFYEDERYNLEQTEATCDWFDSRGDGYGESNAERNA